MASRFEEKPEESNLFTPEVAERIVERFAERQAERQRIEAAERERLASMTRVQELADLLGTTPEEIQSIAQEVRSDVRTLPPQADPTERFPAQAKPTWPIHLAYLCTIAVVTMWALAPKDGATIPAGSTPTLPVSSNPRAPVSALSFDPYLQGYTRSLNPMMGTETQVVTAPTVIAPPPGFQVSIITPLGRKTIYGSPMGAYHDPKESAEALKKTVRSLAAYEESLAKVDPSLPVTPYLNAPWQENVASYQGEPRLVGWHNVEIYDGSRSYRALVPDKRYAKDLASYEGSMQQRLDHLTDTKFFPSLPPANLRPNSIKIEPATALPKGTSIMIWNNNKTVWAQGTGGKESIPHLRTAISSLFGRAEDILTPLMGPKEDHLQVQFMVPGGEYYNNWPLTSAEGYTPGQAMARRQGELQDLVDAYTKAIGAPVVKTTSINPPRFP